LPSIILSNQAAKSLNRPLLAHTKQSFPARYRVLLRAGKTFVAPAKNEREAVSRCVKRN